MHIFFKMLRIIICLSLLQLVLSSQLCVTPPAFPDIRQYLKTPESLALVQKLSENNSEKNCSCAFEEGLQEANKYRKDADCNTPYFRCPVQTTIVTIPPTTMVFEESTFVTEAIDDAELPGESVTSKPAKSPIVPTSRSSSTSGSSTTRTPEPSFMEPTTTTSTKKNGKPVPSSTKTTKAPCTGNCIDKPTPSTGSKNAPIRTPKETDNTAIMGAVIACVVVVIIIVGVLLACRKHMSACPGPQAKVHKHPLLKQTTSTAPLVRNTSQKDTYDGSGNGEPVLISPGKLEEGQGNFIFLENTEDFHFNTLKAMEHKHALKHGFGESSTDKTLPRNTLKKQKQKKKKSSKRNSEAKFVITGTPVRQDSNGASKTSDYESMNGNSAEYPDENDNHRRYSVTSRSSVGTVGTIGTVGTEATILSGDHSMNTGIGGPDDDLVSYDNIDLFETPDTGYENMAFNKDGEETPPPHTSTPEEERKSVQLEIVADVHLPRPPSPFMDSEPDLAKAPVAVVKPTVRNSNHNSLESLTDQTPNEPPPPNSSDNTNSGMNEIKYMTYNKKPEKLDPSRYSFLQDTQHPFNTLSKPPIFQNGDINNKNGPFIPVSKTNGIPNGRVVNNHDESESSKYGDTRL